MRLAGFLSGRLGDRSRVEPTTGESPNATSTMPSGPLGGVRVIEMGQLLAGPFCGQLLGDFGAEVIKIEPPGKGDPMRDWGRERVNGKTLWWPIVARNKKSVTIDLRTPEGQRVARRLIAEADVCAARPVRMGR
jgi:succinyl-CoA---D-citramalate CoA-transferase